MADEFRHDVAGFMGNPVARTPNLDRLANGAVVFDRAYTPSPVCVPARQCLATGRYPLHIGCEGFHQDIPPGSATFARHFSEYGYYTVACGKLHHRGPDQMQGWLHRIGAETALAWPERFSSRSQIGRLKWRGATELRESGAGRSPLAYHDDHALQGACDFLTMHFGGLYAIPPETPILLLLSLQQPHFPLLTEKSLLNHYLDRVPVCENQPPSGHPDLDTGRLGPEQGVQPSDIRRATAAYYGMVEETDRRIGCLLKTLAATGQDLSDWIVVFTSDHGDMLGQHGLWGKRKFYEASARVPLFLSAPGLPPGRSSRLCNLVDLFPTLTDLCGLPAAPALDGTSLFSPRDPGETFCQHEHDQFMIRRDNWKFLRLPGGPDVLFELDTDPGETRNRIADPACASVVDSLRSRIDTFVGTGKGQPPKAAEDFSTN